MDDAITPPAPALDERTIIIVTSLGHAVCHLGELAFSGVFVAVMTEFQLDPVQGAALGVLGYVLMGVGAIPAGLWADFWGPTRVFGIYFLAMAVAALTVILAPNIWFLFAALTLVGLAASLYHPVGLAMLSLGVSPSSRGRAMGINGVAGSLGIAAGPSLGLLAAGMGMWRLVYVAVAIASLTAFGLMAWAARRGSKIEDRGSRSENQKTVPLDPRSSIFDPRFLALGLLLVTMMLGGLNYRMLVTALPPFFGGGVDADTAKKATGGLMVFISLIAGGLGQYGGGWLADRFGARRIYPFLIVLLALFALPLWQLEGNVLALPVACCVAVSLFGTQPVENSLLADWTSRSRRSSWYGIKFALTFGVGALGLQVAGSVWKWAGTPAYVFVVLAVSAALMAGLATTALWVRRGKDPISLPMPTTMEAESLRET